MQSLNEEADIMCKIAWNFMEPLTTDKIIEDFETDYAYQIPGDLRVLIQEHNRAYPDNDTFDKPREGMVFSHLLSFNRNSTESVFFYLDTFKEKNTLRALPFGTDGFGNLICEKNGSIYFWSHETDQMEFIADSVKGFLEMLHS